MKPYYQDEWSIIYLGDCREILPELPKVDLVLTDPPYGINFTNHDPVGGGGHRRQRSYYIANDNSTDCVDWLIKWWSGALIVFAPAEKPYQGDWNQWLIWDKGNQVGMGGEPTMYWKKNWELILTHNLGKLNGKREPAVLHFHVLSGIDFELHPNQKPIALIYYLISKTNAQIILDPFMGSGTTLVAAKKLGRKAIGIEISEKYCEIAVKRLQQSVMQLEISREKIIQGELKE
jgi:DNA modification methylase